MSPPASDFLVIGSGIAGLSFALRVAEAGPVTIVTKKAGVDSATNTAQGGIAAVVSPGDSFEAHLQDTLRAGAGLCREQVVRHVIARGPATIERLVDLGVRFDRAGEGYDLGREGGHSHRRVLHASDLTGQAIESALLARAEAHPRITFLPHRVALDLITSTAAGLPGPARIVAARVLDPAGSKVTTLRARVILLATGGCGRAYRLTSNPAIATGDGIAMAYRAGAGVANMEFIQFHPTCLLDAGEPALLISEAVRGEGAVLRNASGETFMTRHHELADLAPRDIVARAIDSEMRRTGADHVDLDCTGLDARFLRRRFPGIHAQAMRLGHDMTARPLPVVPVAHYVCGGVVTGLAGETDITNLFAAGETACTGLHGANRLASNSLLEGAVFAEAAAAAAIARLPEIDPVPELAPQDPQGRAARADAARISGWCQEIRRLLWSDVGIVRSDAGLARAEHRLESLHTEINDCLASTKAHAELAECRNLAQVALLIIRSALSRRESRGLHFSLDAPEPDPTQARDTILRRE